MSKVAVLQQLNVNQGQFIIGKRPEKTTYQQPKYCTHLVLLTLVGGLLCGIALASVLTLYLKEQSCASESTICVSTTTVTSQTQVNQTNSSAATKEAYYCRGVAPYTLWGTFSPNGITINIDTSNCSFASTPLYFTSVAGTAYHWDLAGYGAIYYPTSASFRIYALSLVNWNSTQMLSYSQTYQWSVNWFGISY